MRFLALINPRAGGSRGRALVGRVQRGFQRGLHGGTHACTWESPASPAAMRARIRASRVEGFDAVLLAGGDGTLSAAWSALREAGRPLGVIPTGRGNDFARALHHAGGSILEWDYRSEPQRLEIDLPEINGTPFGSVACAGFDARVNRLALERRGRLPGSLGYAACVYLALRDLRAFPICLTMDGVSREEPVVMVSVANGSFYGGGMRIAPRAAMDDGLLDVCVVREVGRWELARQFPRVYRGTHLSHSRVFSATARRVEITTDAPREIFADGEFVGWTPLRGEIGGRLAVLSFGRGPSGA